MRHLKKKKFFRGGHAQRLAFLKQSAASLLVHGKIMTTATRSRHIRPYVERLITIGKKDTLANRRLLIKKIGDPKIADKVLKVISPKYAKRAGGYTRVAKIGPRQGDGAWQVLVTLI